ncbi:LysR family transcriptional regulator [Klebsiella sp. 2680]|uniref:LysR family transcriptional regulator n=1 Tax=Klebsiella sp. 2680 TaxID=2018037 RepID=UPI001159E7B6|nr:LysR family transcriptional regulator [Klebsiella sp. 2680]
MLITDLKLLMLFIRIVELGSISAAARELALTVPAASRRLRSLEDQMGVRLLQRTTRSQSLTPEGEILYRHARQWLDEVDYVEQQISERRTEIVGNLRMTAPVALGRRYVAPAIATFCARYPALQVQLLLSDSVLDPVENGLDIAIRFGGLHDSSYISRRLVDNHRILCASPAYLQQAGMPAVPADLAQHSCLVIGHHPLAEWVFVGDISVKINARMMSNDGEVVHRWALDGYGIARKSSWDVTDDLRTGRLVPVLPDFAIPAAPLHAIYHSRILAPRVRLFLDYLEQCLRSIQHSGQASATASGEIYPR